MTSLQLLQRRWHLKLDRYKNMCVLMSLPHPCMTSRALSNSLSQDRLYTGCSSETLYHIILFSLQIVIMTRNEGDGWLVGKSGESEGLFPENYVEKLQAV